MKKMERKREQKRTAILESAQETFRADGYIGANMDTIARKAGVTKQTVYRYFDSKETLFQATLEAQRDSDRSDFLDELDRPDAREALTRFAMGFLMVHMSERHLAGIRLMLSEGPTAPEMTRAYFAVGPQKTHERMAAFLKERFQVEDPEYAIRMLISTLLSMRMNVLVGLHAHPTKEELAEHAKQTVTMFMRLFSC